MTHEPTALGLTQIDVEKVAAFDGSLQMDESPRYHASRKTGGWFPGEGWGRPTRCCRCSRRLWEITECVLFTAGRNGLVEFSSGVDGHLLVDLGCMPGFCL